MKRIGPFNFFLGLAACFFILACTKRPEEPTVNKPQLFVPTAFTPNGDNVNDTFLVTAKPALIYYDIKIYENSNILIYESHDISKGWDGTSNSKPEPAGSYLWVIGFRASGTANFSQNGYVELVR